MSESKCGFVKAAEYLLDECEFDSVGFDHGKSLILDTMIEIEFERKTVPEDAPWAEQEKHNEEKP